MRPVSDDDAVRVNAAMQQESELSVRLCERRMTDRYGLVFAAGARAMRDIVAGGYPAMACRAVDRDAVAARCLGHVAHAIGDRDDLRDRAPPHR